MSLRSNRKSSLQPQPLRVTGKLAEVLRLVIHEATQFHVACEQVGMTTYAARQALDKPHVQQWVKREKQVRLESLRLETLNDLARIKGGNGAAAVSAIQMLEDMASPQGQNAATVAATTPGVTINIINGIAGNPGQPNEGQHVQGVTIDAEPTQSLDHPAISPESPQKSAGGGNDAAKSIS